MIKWCRLCVLPDTRPNLNFDKSGICSACLNHNKKSKINWNNRKTTLDKILITIKKKKGPYDCLIPVSGGKDSTWQTIKCLELGLKPLALTWKTPFRSKIGSQNLKNLIDLGVDHIDWTINPKLEKKIMLKALIDKGSTAILMHLAIFNIPRVVACKFKIPLIIWGENSAYEYSNEKNTDKNSDLDNRWLKKFSVTNNFKVNKTRENENRYSSFFLNDKSIKQKEISQVKSIFLGHFYKWDPVQINKFAKKSGFRNANKPKTGYYNFADIDDECIINIHHWLKWYKFGFTRVFDNLSLEIRNGRISRNKAIKILKKDKFKYPHKEIKKFTQYCGITTKKFFMIAEKFRNKKIWKKNKKKQYYIENFIFKRNWNENN